MNDLVRFLNPNNYIKKARRSYWLAKYNQKEWDLYQNECFDACGLDAAQGKKKLLEAKSALGISVDDTNNMASVHWLLFSCLSLKYKHKRILEIGTFDGEATKLLSFLFPEAEIVTVDLPEDDPILKSSYGRDIPEKFDKHIEQRTKNLARNNIKFVATNSMFLLDRVSGKFDLIWVDGGHLFPEIAWDISNAYYLCSKGGIIMCDDIIMSPRGVSNKLVSPDSFKVISYLAERTHEKAVFFAKRPGAKWSADPLSRKFVSFLKKV